ncbi:MAG: sialidase family protein, partial [Armatimonadota bacterium]
EAMHMPRPPRALVLTAICVGLITCMTGESIAMERYVAIDNVCAWPNLTLLPNGDIIAVIFNQPCHGTREGDVEAWASTDDGRTWQLRGVVAPHEPDTVRMNVAAGLAHDGALVALVSGWSNREPLGDEPISGGAFRSDILEPWVCRSDDGGRTWEHTADAVTLPPDVYAVIPFGDIVQADENTLVASFYSRLSRAEYRPNCYVTLSHDDGRTWPEYHIVGEESFNETALLRTSDGTWLAAARTMGGGRLDLFAADDPAGAWEARGALTLPRQHPGHLLELDDGRILATFGMRNRGMYGVGVRISGDGVNWSAPAFLVDLHDATDGGYPASVQLDDGTIVTAYYGNRTLGHDRYHMGVVRWEIDEMF